MVPKEVPGDEEGVLVSWHCPAHGCTAVGFDTTAPRCDTHGEMVRG
jgi:hypothetical protein